jgi:hypothetical protein
MMRTLLILCFFLSLGLGVSSWAEGFGTCGGGCGDHTDCPTDCKECVNSGNGLECSTCCVHDEEDCTSPCEWKLGIDGNMQCQNPGVDCSGVSEMPAQKKGLIWALLGSLIAGGLFWRQRSRKIKIKSV